MIINSLTNHYDSTDGLDLNLVLRERIEGVNSFWLSHAGNKYPTLLIMTKDDVASLHFFPKDRDPGLRSVGHVEGLDAGGTSVFYVNSPNEPQEIINDSIVPLSVAIAVAKQFERSAKLPDGVEWFAL